MCVGRRLQSVGFLAVVTTVAFSVAAVSKAAAGGQSGTATRRIALEGAPNLRDLGGYQTTDGKQVRWRRVFRSGQLTALTDKDYLTLAEFGIVAVCDFRREDERKAQPTTWKGPTSPRLLTMVPSAATGTATGTPPDPVGVTRRGGSAQDVADQMRASYASYASRYATSYRQIIDLILEDAGPILYHCTAGKDRTGMFSAVLLLLLGVPRDTVYSDYLLSNDYAATPVGIARYAAAAKVAPAAAQALLGVERSYLDTGLAAIDTQYGSFDGYRRTALKLSDQELARLKARLLIP